MTINLDEYDDTKEVVDKESISEIPKEVLDKVFKKKKKWHRLCSHYVVHWKKTYGFKMIIIDYSIKVILIMM